MFSKGAISMVNKPTRVTKRSVSCIDHIYVNSFFNQDVLCGIKKADVSDYFPAFVIENIMNITNLS